MFPKVAIIMINYNGREDTLECLQSLRLDYYPAKHIILVDNGSTDGCTAAVRSEFPEVQIVETGANLGFTGGNNIGITLALEQKADYIYLLNNDTTLEPASIENLVNAAQANPDAGILAPLIHYYSDPKLPWFAGSQLDLRHALAIHDNAPRSDYQQAIIEIPWCTGCAMLIPAEIMRQVRGFDDRFFLIWEDVDLSLRIKDRGYRLLLVRNSRIFHKVSRSFKSSPVGFYYYVRNHLLFAKLHTGTNYTRASMRLALRYIKRSAFAFLRREPSAGTTLRMTFKAVFDHLQQRYGALV